MREKIRQALVTAVETRGRRRGLTGAEAGIIVRRVDPAFSVEAYGAASFKAFVQSIPELKLIGRSGSDVVYGLDTWSPLSAQADNEPSLWRVLVSPGSQYCLVVQRGSGTIRTSNGTPETRTDDLVVPPAPSEKHREIARSFLATPALPDDLRARLEIAVASESPQWWKSWRHALRAGTRWWTLWKAHRKQAFIEYLATILVEGGLEEEQVGVATDLVQRSASRRQTTHRPPPEADDEADDEDWTLVELVQHVVDDLDAGELRSLRLPLGKVLDALGLDLDRI